jgi:hypothetical protein
MIFVICWETHPTADVMVAKEVVNATNNHFADTPVFFGSIAVKWHGFHPIFFTVNVVLHSIDFFVFAGLFA